MHDLFNEQEIGSKPFDDIGYMLRPNEIWTRAYSCYIAYKAELDTLCQQIAAENKVVTGNMKYAPYWRREDFVPSQRLMDLMFTELGWSE